MHFDKYEQLSQHSRDVEYFYHPQLNIFRIPDYFIVSTGATLPCSFCTIGRKYKNKSSSI